MLKENPVRFCLNTDAYIISLKKTSLIRKSTHMKNCKETNCNPSAISDGIQPLHIQG